MLNIDAVLVGQDAEGNGQTVGEHARILRAGRERRVPHEHFVPGLTGIEFPGHGRAFVCVHRIFQRGHAPHPAMQVPIHRDEFADAFGFAGDEFDFKTGREREGGLFFCRRQRGGFGALLRLRSATEYFPWWRGREFFDGDVLHLHERLAAAVDLDAELAPIGDGGVSLGEVRAHDAVKPGGDARTVGADDVFVPVIALDHRAERLHVRRRQHLVAARLVVKGAPPGWVAIVALVASHLGGIGDALAADLDAAVDEPILAGELDLEADDEIGEVGGAGEEVIVGYSLRQRSAGETTILHAPELRVAFPACESFAIEERRGFAGGRWGFGSAHQED